MQENDLQGIRHTLAHLLACSVRNLFPGAKNTIGPAIEDGFYQDFDVSGVSEKDLPRIEKEMRKVLKTWGEFERREVTVEDALKEFEWNEYKSELIRDLARESKTISFYVIGGFVDLCKGGHANDARIIDPDAFKLTKVAGTTWRGKEDGTKLTRIYGIAFDTKEALETHVKMLEEAEKRDHKKLGPLFGLFTFSDLVGGGLPLFTPKGTVIREQIAGFVQDLQIPRGFQRVTIPHITKRDLYETSGHWDKYEDDLMKIVTREGHEFALKPMNCPHHTQIYASEARSYRDLPVRFSEVTTVYRDEQSGELSGLTRVRMITQDDAHIFCRFSQIEHEALLCWEIIDEFYKPFGMELQVRLSRRDPDDFSKYLGTPEVWEKAEALLLEIIKKKGVQYIDGPGEAAHYGPKIDFICHDSLGRSWQLATIQLDFNMPERFDLTCINEKGEKERIVMIHRAVTGSLERFMGVIIEHFAGAFPLWLAPVQVALLPISDNFLDYAEKVKQELLQTLPLLRVTIDTRSESIGKKIREATIHKIPHQLILGQKEMDAGMVAVRLRNGKDQGQLLIKEYVLQLQDEILNKKIES